LDVDNCLFGLNYAFDEVKEKAGFDLAILPSCRSQTKSLCPRRLDPRQAKALEPPSADIVADPLLI
jgi:hypothetical protein